MPDLLGMKGVVGELGIGTLRNAIAIRLLPGVSTIQTQARFFFVMTYTLREYQDQKCGTQKKSEQGVRCRTIPPSLRSSSPNQLEDRFRSVRFLISELNPDI